jgi:hypothetical protein
VAVLKQAANLTRPQQDEFVTKAADAVAVLIRETETQIDDVLVREVLLPMGAQIINALGARVGG